MKRTMQLLWFQLIPLIKICTILSCGFLLFSGVMVYFFYPSVLNSMSPVSTIVTFCAMFFSFMSFVLPFVDGLTNFDSATRFGIPRKQYFMINLGLYALISLIAIYTTVLDQISATNLSDFGIAFQELTVNYWLTHLTQILFMALLAFGVYRYSWKILFIFLPIPFLIGIAFSIIENLNYKDVEMILTFIKNIRDFIDKYGNYIGVVILAVFIALYYLCITKTETK